MILREKRSRMGFGRGIISDRETFYRDTL